MEAAPIHLSEGRPPALASRVFPHPDSVYPIPNNYGAVHQAGVNLFTGNVNLKLALGTVSGRQHEYTLQAFYNSRSAAMESHVDNALGGYGWKLLDYPKIVQDGSAYYFLDGQVAYRLAGDNQVYTPGGAYYLWRIESRQGAEGLTWTITTETGLQYVLGHQSTESGFKTWHLSLQRDPNWEDAIQFSYEGGQLQAIRAPLGEKMELLYDEGRLMEIRLFKDVGASGAVGVFTDRVLLSFGSPSAPTPLLEQIRQERRLPLGHFAAFTAPWRFSYYAADDTRPRALPLALETLFTTSGAEQSFWYYTGDSVDFHPVIRYTVDNGYPANEFREREDCSANDTCSAIWYGFDNFFSGEDGVYAFYNEVKSYPGGTRSYQNGNPNDPYGHQAAYFFNGNAPNELRHLPADYPPINTSSPAVRGLDYRRRDFFNSDERPDTLITERQIYWGVSYYLSDRRGAFGRLEKLIESRDDVDKVTAYRYSDTFHLPNEVTTTRRNPQLDDGQRINEEQLRLTTRYAFEQYPQMGVEGLHILEAPAQSATWSRREGSADWSLLESTTIQWKSWSAADPTQNWAPEKIYLLQAPVPEDELQRGFDPEPPADWLEVNSVLQRNAYGRPEVRADVDRRRHSTRYDALYQHFPIANFSNADALAGEAGYYGFEAYEGPSGWVLRGGTIASAQAHTGAWSYGGEAIEVVAGEFSPESNRSYVLSAYLRLNESDATCTLGFIQDGGWTVGKEIRSGQEQDGWQLQQVVRENPTPGEKPAVRCEKAEVDDIRFSPVDSGFSASVFFDNERFGEDDVVVHDGESGTFRANRTITVASGFGLPEGESLELDAGQGILWNSGMSVVKGATVRADVLGTHIDLTVPTAFLGPNARTTRSVLNGFLRPVALVGPQDEVRALSLHYDSPWGGHYFEGRYDFDPDFPNMSLAISARQGGRWDGFDFADSELFPRDGLERMEVAAGLLISDSTVSPANEGRARFAGILPKSDLLLAAELIPAEVAGTEEYLGLSVAAGAESHRFVLYGSCAEAGPCFVLEDDQGGVVEKKDLSHLPPATTIALALLSEGPSRSSLFAYAEGRFLFSADLGALPDTVRLVSANPGGAFNNFFAVHAPTLSNMTHDAVGKPRQVLALSGPEAMSIKETIYAGSLDVRVAETKATLLEARADLSFRPQFIESFDPERMEITAGEILGAWPDRYAASAFATSQGLYRSPLLRLENLGSGGVFSSNRESVGFSYGPNQGARFDFEADQLSRTTAKTPEELSIQQYRNQKGELFGEAKVDSENQAIQQQYVYSQATDLLGVYQPNFFSGPTDGGFRILHRYDFLGRLTKNRTPDESLQQTGYDRAGRPRLQLDGNGAGAAEPYYRYTRYDSLGRVAEKGLYSDPAIRLTIPLDRPGSYSAVGSVTFESGEMQAGSRFLAASGAQIAFRRQTSIPEGTTVQARILPSAISSLLQEELDDPSWPPAGEKTSWRKRYVYDRDEGGGTVDMLGRLARIETPDTSTTFEYNADGNTTRVVESLSKPGGDEFRVGFDYSYDSEGKITRIVADDAESYEVEYAYDRLGRLHRVGTEALPQVYAAYAYDNGRITETVQDGSIERSYTLNAAGWVEEIKDPYFRERLCYQGRYRREEDDCGGERGYFNGQVASIRSELLWDGAPSSFDTQFYYDDFGRLRTASSSDPRANVGVVAPLAYDANGNLRAVTRQGETTNYSYELGTNRVHSLGSPREFSYDANGNATSSPLHGLESLSYDSLTGRVVEVEGEDRAPIRFLYNGRDQRVLKEKRLASVSYWHGLNAQPLLEEESTAPQSRSQIAYIYGPTGLLAFVREGVPSFVLKDHLGSTRVIVDEAGRVREHFDYLPFGEIITERSSPGGQVRYLYTGQEYDREIGLYNYRARLYDATLARFYATDPRSGPSSPYAYAENDPVSMKDPTGEIPLLAVLAVPFVISAVNIGYGLAQQMASAATPTPDGRVYEDSVCQGRVDQDDAKTPGQFNDICYRVRRAPPGSARYIERVISLRPEGEQSDRRDNRVRDLEDHERAMSRYRLTVRDGKLYDASGRLYTSRSEWGSKSVRFVISPQGDLYASGVENRQYGGRQFAHSSFLNGEDVAAAGQIIVENGVVRSIDQASGHYRPDSRYSPQWRNVACFLEQNGISSDGVRFHEGVGDDRDTTSYAQCDYLLKDEL